MHIEIQDKAIKESLKELSDIGETKAGLRHTKTKLDFTQFELNEYRGRVEDLEA